jgi:N-acetylglucosamine-6-phosphate deacetylase
MRTLSGRIAAADGSLVQGGISFTDTISAIEPAAGGPADYILPGFIDLQVNGSHGIDVMNASADAILEIAAKLAHEGTTAWMPTAVTSPIERIEQVHRAIAQAIERQKGGGASGTARILGMHLEGPFISPVRLGAHPKLNLEPRGDAFERVLALEHLKILTLAPELDGAMEAIRRLSDRGVVVSLGHTNATLEEAEAGIAAGARMFTHLFNAMRPLGHRDPGVITAALTSTAAMPAIIPDAVHVHPRIMRLVYRARGAAGMILTTDKVSLAGAPADASMPVGRARAQVIEGAARLPDGTIAGSVISMLEGLRRMVREAGAGVGEAALMAASNPAALLGIQERGRLQAGSISDMIVLNPEMELKSVFVAGRELK